MFVLRNKRSDLVILPIVFDIAHLSSERDISRRAVWLGRHPAEKISVGSKDKLIRVGNPK